MGSFTFQTIVLVLIGAAVFALGTINIRGHFRMKRPGVLFKGKVLNVKLLERRDKEDRLIQHYYELQVQCRTTDKTFNIKIKSTTEYEKGEEIQLMQNGDQITMVSNKSISLGIAILIALAGCITFFSYIKERGRNLTEIQGEIVDVLFYRTGDNKKFSKPIESYYPLIQCTIDGKEKIFLSSYNSSRPSVYKIGQKMKLFYDKETKSIVEKRMSPGLLVAAAVLWCLALVGLISSLM